MPITVPVLGLQEKDMDQCSESIDSLSIHNLVIQGAFHAVPTGIIRHAVWC